MSNLKLPDLNEVVLAGRLTRDPQLRYTQGGEPVAEYGVAATKYYRNQAGEKGERTTFVDCKHWGKGGEWVGEALRKGREVLIRGRLDTEQWEDSKTGQKRSKLIVVVQRLQVLSWEDGQQGGGTRPSTAPTRPPQGQQGLPGTGGPPPSSGPPAASQAPTAQSQRKPYDEEPIPEDDIPF